MPGRKYFTQAGGESLKQKKKKTVTIRAIGKRAREQVSRFPRRSPSKCRETRDKRSELERIRKWIVLHRFAWSVFRAQSLKCPIFSMLSAVYKLLRVSDKHRASARVRTWNLNQFNASEPFRLNWAMFVEIFYSVYLQGTIKPPLFEVLLPERYTVRVLFERALILLGYLFLCIPFFCNERNSFRSLSFLSQWFYTALL